jgi:hypothetical protein
LPSNLDAVLRAAANLTAREQESPAATETDPERYQEIDRASLLLCIALLDHPLHGNIHDNVIVGLLAVLGFNSQGAYHEATTYTPSISAFVKLSQLLVVQRAVLAVDEDEVDHPSDYAYTHTPWYPLRVPRDFVKRVPRKSKVLWYPLLNVNKIT